MAMPNRHVAISALPAIALVHFFPAWWAWVLGIIWAFWSHTFVDNISNEYWQRNNLQNILAGSILGTLFIVVCVALSIKQGWLLACTMIIAALGQDIIDTLLEKNGIRPMFPSHFGADCYVEPWLKEESFTLTMILEAAAAIITTYLAIIM